MRELSHPLLTAIDREIPLLKSLLAQGEEQRCLPDEAVDCLRRSGVFRMAVPADLGGWEADPLLQLRAVEMLAEVDASVGWYAIVGSDGGFYCSFLDPSVAKRLYGADPNVVTAGFVEPAGVARPVEGGYLISGRWPFGSATYHSTWIASGCRVSSEHGDDPADGRWIVAMLPRVACELHDTWHTVGLRASGSFDYTTRNHYVASEATFSFLDGPQRDEPLYQFPLMYRANVPGVALGAARGAVKEFMEWIADRQDPLTGVARRESAHVQSALGKAEAAVAAARSYAEDVIGELWDVLLRGGQPDLGLRARFRLMIVHTGVTCRSAVQTLFEACGGSVIFDRHPLQRRLRDVTTIAQHALLQEPNYALSGRVLIGLPPHDQVL
ncbi:acyl-CoA dehydrogenase family protein [Nonomuraea angiospora]|uniref:acyl-CoA dehydrogenase family protein n=1 Tax=Nonomuraea angiospora TaxID=46172 RepID=UPI0029A3D8E5|nr:acyl-CoA dehydrogenase family protein [Nonomuraea angiospora]MDX3103357.1 acyl-CoA dehydrogenase family protein [Nonomuraea angiospora]